MRLLIAAVVIVLAGSALDRAQADQYPWCAVYGDNMGGSSNCYMPTLEQCRAAISGQGGFCQRNPFYSGRASDGRSGKRRDY